MRLPWLSTRQQILNLAREVGILRPRDLAAHDIHHESLKCLREDVKVLRRS